MSIPSSPEPLLTPAEVASMFRVDAKTVTRWAKAGRLSAIKTLGGHRRFRESEVRALLNGATPPPVEVVDVGGRTVAMRSGVKIGEAWSIGTGSSWFARRVDRRDGETRTFPSREQALEFLKGGS